MSSAVHCFHCGELVPVGFNESVEIDGLQRPMCCPGCAAAAHAIVSGGLSNYYTFRTEQADKLNEADSDVLQELQAYDLADIQSEFVEGLEGNFVQALFTVEGIRCAACAWLIEQRLGMLPQVETVDVNVSAHRLRIAWDSSSIKLSEILMALRQVGYHAFPFKAHDEETLYRKSYKNYLIRLGIAGLATMQVMMFAVALYFGVFSGIDDQHHTFLRVVSLLMATPVVLYSAFPFYLNAIRGIQTRQLNMDVPVSIALLLAYFTSAYATLTKQGEVYFESVSMFTFFLLLGRFLEMNARRRASEHSSNLLKLLPSKASKITAKGVEIVAAARLCAADIILIKPGEHVPVDARITQGTSDFDESMLTGESLPQSKGEGAIIYGGAINGQHPIQAEVVRGRGSSLANEILKLQDKALQQKPKIVKIADFLSRWFVSFQLLIATTTYLVWLSVSPNDALWITLSVLVATCPCALALATPTALTCATSQFSKLGVLIRHASFVEALPKASAFVFDKTGTLTLGELQLTETRLLRDVGRDPKHIAALLEAQSQHPIARAFSPYLQDKNVTTIGNVRNLTGLGMEGDIDGSRYKIGSAELCGIDDDIAHSNGIDIFLADQNGPIAHFVLTDKVRSETPWLINWLHKRRFHLGVLSGDPSANSADLISGLPFDFVSTGLKPSQKLKELHALQQQHKVVAVGDGINDAPLLAAADLSIAMGSGSDLAKVSADAVIPSSKLQVLRDGINLASRTRSIIKQNLMWSLGYNAVIIPLAVSGLIAPYFAALGMSVSSLIVVSNSLRLLK